MATCIGNTEMQARHLNDGAHLTHRPLHSPTRYFTKQFPNMLMTVYVFAAKHMPSDAKLITYWPPGGVEACMPFLSAFDEAPRPGGGGGVALF